MARREFLVNASPSTAILSITASNRYLLYVNGKYIGRGPARSGQFWKSYDTYDVAGDLHQGKNVVAVLAYYYGVDNNYSRDERAGLFVQLNATTPAQANMILGTDRSWRLRQARSWKQDGVRPGVQEVYNATWNDRLDGHPIR